jgi:hypothetical protein
MAISSQDVLQQLSKGEISNFKKYKPAIADGKKITNRVLRNLILVFRNKKLTDEQIIEKILKYDQWVEEGKLTNEMLDKK